MTTEKPIRVLHVLGTTNLGGAESRVMELYRSIDRERVQFDFLIHTQKEGHYSAEINSRILGWIADGTGLVTEENYLDRLEAEYEFYTNFDYGSIYN